MNEENVSSMVGKTMATIVGCEPSSDAITFTATDGSVYIMYHDQDCCESVSVNEVIGDVKDLIGEPLLMAEAVDSKDAAPPPNPDSFTWTFYKFATIKGYVTVRWLGESNGYYSESVDFKQTT